MNSPLRKKLSHFLSTIIFLIFNMIAASYANAESPNFIKEFSETAQFIVKNPKSSEIYVTTPFHGVLIIDSEKLAIVSTIPISNGLPLGLAVSSDGTKLYLGISAISPKLEIIDIATRSIIKSISLPQSPNDISVDNNGYVYASEDLPNGNILRINPETGQIDNLMQTQDNGNGLLAFSPNSNTLYYASQDPSVATIDSLNNPSAKNPYINSVTLGTNGLDLYLDDANHQLYYIDQDVNYYIQRISTLDMSQQASIPMDSFPTAVTVSPDGKTIYAIEEFSSAYIQLIDNSTFQKLCQIDLNGVDIHSPDPRKLMFDRTGKYLFVSYNEKLKIYHSGCMNN